MNELLIDVCSIVGAAVIALSALCGVAFAIGLMCNYLWCKAKDAWSMWELQCAIAEFRARKKKSQGNRG